MFILFWLLIGAAAICFFAWMVWTEGEDFEVRHLPWCALGVVLGPLTALFLGFVVITVWWGKLTKNRIVLIKGRKKTQ